MIRFSACYVNVPFPVDGGHKLAHTGEKNHESKLERPYPVTVIMMMIMIMMIQDEGGAGHV